MSAFPASAALGMPPFRMPQFQRQMGTATATAVVVRPRQIEDPLAHLPCSIITEYRKGDTIYSSQAPPSALHLVIDGKVKVCREVADGRQVVVDIYLADEFFGESAFVGGLPHSELAVAIDDTKVMSWTIAEIEEMTARRPKLAMALVQLMVQRCMEFGRRIEGYSVDNIARRLARALIRFSDRLGEEAENGSVHMIPFTHELLSQYVGTSREIITQYMNQFRRQGFLRYSRKGILLNRAVTEAWLSGEPAQKV